MYRQGGRANPDEVRHVMVDSRRTATIRVRNGGLDDSEAVSAVMHLISTDLHNRLQDSGCARVLGLSLDVAKNRITDAGASIICKELCRISRQHNLPVIEFNMWDNPISDVSVKLFHDLIFAPQSKIRLERNEILMQPSVAAFCGTQMSNAGVDLMIRHALEYFKPSKQQTCWLRVDSNEFVSLPELEMTWSHEIAAGLICVITTENRVCSMKGCSMLPRTPSVHVVMRGLTCTRSCTVLQDRVRLMEKVQHLLSRGPAPVEGNPSGPVDLLEE
eukprot:TRINITY_DN25798_c0_g1_i2.p2 TRINITY_DN25798_c0_g1~~TRINITY_DN25798_c0_g1_i2.p2  ORF type:complete len:274 (+),score=47.88 TRINITY_DN25798_c0_g1_i2:115-936(+)